MVSRRTEQTRRAAGLCIQCGISATAYLCGECHQQHSLQRRQRRAIVAQAAASQAALVQQSCDTIASRLAQRRYDLKWTLMNVAERAGVSVQTVGNLENSQRRGTMVSVLQVGRALGFSAEELFNGIL